MDLVYLLKNEQMNSVTTTSFLYEDELQKSLESAKIVQEGLLPKKRHLKRVLGTYFTLYKPRDVISGDFYWVGRKHGLDYLVVGDCTGHGISASLLSVLALNLFEYVIMNKGIKRVNKILQEVDKKFIESFSRDGLHDNPWIDLSIVCIDRENNKIHYSSANRKMLIVSNYDDYHVIRGSRYPIGGWQIEDNRTFTATILPFEQGDMLYLGSDGFQDQMGGMKGKKFKSKRLHELLRSLNDLPINEQKKYLEKTFVKWAANTKQTDDICIVGLRL